MSEVLIVGSIGYDLVFEIHGAIKDKIILESGSVKNLDLLFTAKDLRKMYGGIAGNIAYGLGNLHTDCAVFSVVGADYKLDYGKYLSDLGVKDYTVALNDRYTAAYYAVSDSNKDLIGVWQPNAHDEFHKFSLNDTIPDFSNVEYAIFSPGTSASMAKHIPELRQLNSGTKIIFDPGPVINFFDLEDLKNSLNFADIIIGNEIEIPILLNKLGLSISDVINMSKTIIETLGSKGSKIYTDNGTIVVAPIKVDAMEATGAGDAFRAGLLHGLAKGKNIEDSAKIGSYLGALSTKFHGGQGYSISENDLNYIRRI